MFNGIVDQKCTGEELKYIREKHASALNQLTNGLMNKPGVQINLVGRDDNGKVIGGIMCSTYLQVMFIDVLWVNDLYRGRGVGHALITQAERMAKEVGCIYVHTSTYSFQSPDFYKRQGYDVYGKNDCFPYDMWYINLRKKLENTEMHSPIFGGLIDENCSEAELEEIVCKGLRQYNDGKTKGMDMKNCGDINIVARDEEGKIIGGIMCSTFMMVMYINILWVHESYQGQGIDDLLLKEAESIRIESGGQFAHTSTYSFHTHEFFKSHGYEAYDIDDYYPDNICLYAFKKKL